MISAGEFRKGQTIEIDGQVWVIVDFQHVKPGKGAAFVRTKIKNVIQGNVLERTFSPTDRFERAHVESKSMTFLYNDGSLYYFMDNDSYEQLPLDEELVRDAMPYVKENSSVDVKFFKGQAFSVEPPQFCRTGRNADGSRRQGRHRNRGHQAGNGGNRRRHQRAAFCQRRGCHPRGYAHRGVHVPRIKRFAAFKANEEPQAPPAVLFVPVFTRTAMPLISGTIVLSPYACAANM